MLRISGCGKVLGTVVPDSDKSISHRAIMLGAIAEGRSKAQNLLFSEDVRATIECFIQLGTGFEFDGNTVTIAPVPLKKPESILYTANSGTTTRLLAGILSAQAFDATLSGDTSLNSRPMQRILTPLRLMGAKINAREDKYCPLRIEGGKLHGIDYYQEVASAQQKSAILLAGLYAQGKTRVFENAQSRNHTEIMLREMGADIEITENCISVSRGRLQATDRRVPGDISTAAFFMALAAIKEGARVTIKNVGLNPTRTGIIDILEQMGAEITIDYTKTEGEAYGDITVTGRGLRGVEIGGQIIPRLIDELPIICVCAAFAQGTTVIKDAAELKVKESNRIKSMVEQLRAGGINAYELPDGMVIEGGKGEGGDFYSYNDHRIAMSMIIFALCAQGESTVSGEECIGISAPNFVCALSGLAKDSIR